MSTTTSATPSVDIAASTAGPLSQRRITIIFATVLMAMLLSALDQTIVSTALPTIVSDLGGGHLSWVVSAYLLADTIATVLAGKLSDLFGRKRVLQLSAAVFVVASATCGFATGMTWLIAWRAVQGLGAGGLSVTASAVLADVVPLKQRAKYQGALGAMFGVALVLGPLLGGVFTDDLSWRWVFLINLPLGLAVLALASVTIPTLPRGDKPTIDYAGIAFVSAGSAALTLALSWGGNSYAWGSLTIVGLFVGAAIAFAVFIAVEARAVEPILPLRLFKGQIFSVTVVLAFIVGFAMLGALTFLPTYSQYVMGISPTASGVRTLPLVAGLLGTSLFTGAYVSKTGRYKPFPIAGLAVMAVGMWLLSRLTPSSTYLTLALDMVVLGAGIGLSMQVLTVIVQNATSFRDLGVATSGVGFFRTLGSSFGVAIFGTIFSTTLAPRLGRAVIASGVSPAVVTSPKALHQLPAAQIAPVLEAYSHALHVLFLWAVPVSVVGFVLALFLKQLPLRDSAQASATDVGDGFGVPVGDDRVAQLETAIARAFRAAGPAAAVEIARDSGTGLDTADAWCVGAVTARTRQGLAVSLTAIATEHHLPAAVLRPAFDAARLAGWLDGDDGALRVTERGAAELDRLAAGARRWIGAQLADWNAEGDPAYDTALRNAAKQLVA